MLIHWLGWMRVLRHFFGLTLFSTLRIRIQGCEFHELPVAFTTVFEDPDSSTWTLLYLSDSLFHSEALSFRRFVI